MREKERETVCKEKHTSCEQLCMSMRVCVPHTLCRVSERDSMKQKEGGTQSKYRDREQETEREGKRERKRRSE